MIEPKFINKEDLNSESLNYETLLEKGIEYVQKFSGNQWSDYNYHDPGITFLEQLCFALTDLGFKTNFSIESLLLAGQDGFDLENNNLLIPPDKIFPSRPLTLNDFRKIIINQEENIKNAWVNPSDQSPLGIQGTYDVLLQLKDNLSESEISDSLLRVENILSKNRSICTDFATVKVLKEDKISISGDITINSFVLGESILAEIFVKIDSRLNKELVFYDFDDLIQGNSYEDIFCGPAQKNRFIKETDLVRKTNEIYFYEIKEIIQSVEGVVGVENLVVYKNGVKTFNEIISFQNDFYPSLDKNYVDYNSNSLKFIRNDTSYEIDAVILSQLYDSIALKNKNTYTKNFISKKTVKKGEFTKKEIEKYYSIQNELPSIYGLKENELSRTDSSSKRKSQVNQLKGYLLLFDQLMANYLSQLVNVRNLFSIENSPESLKTYFNQLPDDINKIQTVIGKDQERYLAHIDKSSESDEALIKRKNMVLDHLLSRFGETFDTNLISKLDRVLNENLSEHEIQINALITKLNYCKSIVELGENRIKAFNYNQGIDVVDNISGFQKRLCLLLNINNQKTSSCIDPIHNSSSITKVKSEWKIKKIELNDGLQISVLALSDNEYLDEEATFYCQNYSALKSLFLYAHKSKSYQIVALKSGYCIIYNSPNQSNPVKIYRSKTIENCEETLSKLLLKYKKINLECESFFMVENILLRQQVDTKHELVVYSDEKQKLLNSYYNLDYKELRDIRDDLWVSVLKEDNFFVEKDQGKFIITIYDILNNPILKSIKSFNSEAVAELEKIKLIEFFITKKGEQIELDSLTEIMLIKNNENSFPDDFNYSNQITFVFPDWPIRFQNNEFKSLVETAITSYIPAHVGYTINYLSIEKMSVFEDIYFKWLDFKLVKDEVNFELQSLQLIQLIRSYNPYVGK